MKHLLTIGCLFLFCSLGFAQINLDVEGSGVISEELGVGTNSIDAKAQTQIDATDKGLLIPRMNTAARMMISATGAATMPEGLIVYDTDEQAFYYWDASIPNWNAVATGAGGTNTDSQTLTFDAMTGMLSISNGNAIDLSSLQDGVDDADASPTNELIEGVTLNWRVSKPFNKLKISDL